MEIPDIPFDAVSYTLVAVTFALPMVFPVSLALLWVYLRAVKRSMLKRAAEEPLAQPVPSAHDASGQTTGPPERPLRIATMDARAIPGKWTARRRADRAGVIHAIAGLAFAYVMGTAYLLAAGLGFDWQVALYCAMFFTWPLVITLGLVCTVSWLGLGLLVLGYALVLAATIAVLTTGTTITAGASASLWFALNRDATLLALASLAPPIRAVGPLVAVFMIAVVVGAIFILPVVYNSDTAFPAALEQRLAETEPRCDPDGRYRSSSFFCYDDTWKMVLGRLAEDSDAVLMDLRGFTMEARGCIYEINELLDVMPLECIVFIIDRTSDEIGLAHVFYDGWARIGRTSPNRSDLTPHVHLVRFDGLHGHKIANLVALVAATSRRRNRTPRPPLRAVT